MFCVLVGVLVPYGSSLVGFMCCCFCCLSFLLCGVFMFVHGQYCCVMFGVGVFIVGALIGTVFDGIQKRVYDNRKRWDREA